MTILDRPLTEADADADADEAADPTSAFSVPGAADGAGDGAEKTEGGGGGAGEPTRLVRVPLVALAAALACTSAAWMVTRVFHDSMLAFLVAMAGVVVGTGTMFLAERFNRSTVLQFAAFPVGGLIGAVLATTAAGPGASLPTLVQDALRGGGLLQPPIPFDPGWRFLVVFLFTVLSAASCGLGIALARPKLTLSLAFPVALGAALLQPKGNEFAASAVAMVLLVAALGVAYGSDLAAEGVMGGGFELRRLLRGTALMTGVLVGLVAIAQTDFLFPDTNKDEVIPPQKPPKVPPEPDREMFRVRSELKGPWRVGILDVYEDNAFLLPSVDPKRVVEVPRTGAVSPPLGPTYTVDFEIVDVKGQTLFSPANPTAVRTNKKMTFDPRTQLARLVDTSVPRGFKYTVEASRLPDNPKVLAEAPEPGPALKEFTDMPPPPPGVADLLLKADEATKNRFDRLQFVRTALYTKVVSAGGGLPIDVPPARVDAMIAGGEATPYEINAAEVMLARWAGIPARLGFGFYGGDQVGDAVSFRPRHGAAWLEAYYEGQGWIPIIGTPPKAKPSISKEEKKNDPTVLPTDDLALTVFVPVELTSVKRLYETIRYYTLVGIPVVAGLVALVMGYPAAFKAARRRRRLRWAEGKGGLGRIVVAYCEFRDRCYDLNIGDPRHTPLEFLAAVKDDDEHAELAWLVSRTVWGDLGRDLHKEDVESAERLAASVLRRVDRAQTGTNRLLGHTSRASLRDPWTDEVPNLWPQRKRAAVPLRVRLRRLRQLPQRLRRGVAAVGASMLALLLLGGCGGSSAKAEAPVTFPDPLMPAKILNYDLQRRVSAEKQYTEVQGRGLATEGRVFTITEGNVVQGSIQVALLKDKVNNRSRKVQQGIEQGLGGTEGFRTVRYGTVRLRVLELPEQNIYLWFPPERNAMEVFIMRKKFGAAEQVVLDLIDHQRTAAPGTPGPPEAPDVPPLNPGAPVNPGDPGNTSAGEAST